MSFVNVQNALRAAGLALIAATALAQHEQSSPATGKNQPVAATSDGGDGDQPRPSDPYPLATCPVSGKRLGAMGDPVVTVYDGREVRFCCPGCIEKFEAAKDDYWKKVDAAIVEQQLPFYPIATCVISDEPLVDGGEDIAINFVHQNRLIRFCCRGCVKDFRKDPEQALAKLDAAVITQQRATYPLNTCVVSGKELGKMGEPTDVVIDNRLVRLCCPDCEAKLRAAPLTYLQTLDAAWEARGMPATLPSGAHDADHDHDHDAAHGDAHGGH